MSVIGDFIKKNSVAEQMMIWGVLSQFIAPLLEPVFRSIEHEMNSIDPNMTLSPEILADMVNRGHFDPGDAAEEAKQSGIDSVRFSRLVRNAGNPPGPEALAEALRREFIPPTASSPDDPSYIQGIRESRLQVKWADVVKQLDMRLPGPSAPVIALVRGMLEDPQARKLFKMFGGDPTYFDLEYNIAGEGPTPVEAGVMANRRIIDWDGLGPDRTTFQQAVAESRFKTKWTAKYKDLAQYRPPPRTITAMFREGSVDPNTATRMLQDYGVPDSVIPTYLNKAEKKGVQRAHEITETEIIRLYEERGISQEECRQLLINIGYSAEDTTLIINAADLQYFRKLTDETLKIIHSLYVHRHIDRNGVVTRLDAVGVSSTYRDSLVQLWDMEIEGGVKQLTEKQVVSMVAARILDRNQGIEKLHQIGYSPADAELIIRFEIDNQLDAAQSQQIQLAAP